MHKNGNFAENHMDEGTFPYSYSFSSSFDDGNDGDFNAIPDDDDDLFDMDFDDGDSYDTDFDDDGADDGDALTSYLEADFKAVQEYAQVSEFNVRPSDLGGKKIAAINDLAYNIIQTVDLLSTAGDRLFSYDAEFGCYRPLHNPERFIAKVLKRTGHLNRLTVHEIKDLCTRISWDPQCYCDADTFNQMPNCINATNGTVNYMDGILMEHSASHRFTYAVQAKYLEDSSTISCPVFEAFCQSSLSPLSPENEDMALSVIQEKRQLLLEIIGYICSDSNAGKCALFLKGEPDSGKSVVANFITRLFFPELISNIPLHKLSDRFNKAELFGRKLNVAGEIQGKRLTEISTFKSVTGNDSISAEFKGKDPFSFTPRCKLLFAGNALPGTLESDATRAFTNRLVVLLFNHSIPNERQDKELLNKLWNERDSIFTLAVNALRDLAQRNFCFTLPEESLRFLESFAERGNSLQAFLRDCCILKPHAKVHNTELLSAYEQYCLENGLEQFSKQRLYDMLSGIPGVSTQRIRIGRENRWGHIGISLRNSTQNGTLEQSS